MLKIARKLLLLTAIFFAPLNAFNISHYTDQLWLGAPVKRVLAVENNTEYVQYTAYSKETVKYRLDMYNKVKKMFPIMAYISGSFGLGRLWNAAKSFMYLTPNTVSDQATALSASMPTPVSMGYLGLTGLSLATAYLAWDNRIFTLFDSINAINMDDSLIAIDDNGKRIPSVSNTEVNSYAQNANVIWVRVKNPTIVH